VGGGPGGYYTQAQYSDLVEYAQARNIMIVPEIDMPGHTNAAIASYPELACDGVAPPLYTGIRVGFSALCPSKESTYAFVEDVVRELAELTPGPYLHLGGDEVEKLTRDEYLRFVERVERIVRAQGKNMIGWGEIAPANLDPGTVVQHWRSDARASRDSAHLHAERGGSIIMSPGNRTYLDMKYDSTTVLGLRWAGMISVQHAYAWEPSTFLPRVPARSVLGVEAPLWAETLEKRSDYEFLAFPRLIAIAELGWSRPNVRGWDGFRLRLAEHGPRLQAMGVNFYRSPEIPWR
jgi:hexosaminidase